MTFSTVGSLQTWELTEAQLDEWQADFPRIDVREECAHAHAWTLANHKKTARGMRRFLVAWLIRASKEERRYRAVPVQTERRWVCPHVQRCDNREKCQIATMLERPERAKAEAS